MNRIIRAIGKYNTVGDERKLCLAACQDQVNAVSVTSSNFPNRETFVEREEFCLLVEKLIRTCKSVGKYYVLSKFYPNLCLLLWEIRNVTDSKGQRPMCDQMKWTPRDMGFDEKDPRQELLKTFITAQILPQDPQCSRTPLHLCEEQLGRGEYLHQGAGRHQHLEGPEDANYQLHRLHWRPPGTLYGLLSGLSL